MELDATTAVTARALDGVYLRQLAVAHNIANANSPGFVPIRVSFEEALQEVAGGDKAQIKTAPISVTADDLEPLRLDMEITESAENAMRYSMLLSMLDRKLQIMSIAINEGRAR